MRLARPKIGGDRGRLLALALQQASPPCGRDSDTSEQSDGDDVRTFQRGQFKNREEPEQQTDRSRDEAGAGTSKAAGHQHSRQEQEKGGPPSQRRFQNYRDGQRDNGRAKSNTVGHPTARKRAARVKSAINYLVNIKLGHGRWISPPVLSPPTSGRALRDHIGIFRM